MQVSSLPLWANLVLVLLALVSLSVFIKAVWSRRSRITPRFVFCICALLLMAAFDVAAVRGQTLTPFLP